MDTHLLAEPRPAHRHEARRRSERAFPVVLVISFLVFSACAAFAVVMTNGPDGRANAEPIPAPTLSGGTSVIAGQGPDATVEPLSFTAAMPGGPVLLGEPGRLVITVSNPHAHAVQLDTFDIRVGQPTVPGCRAEWLNVAEYAGGPDAITVPARGTARVTLPYELRDLPSVNQDACKGAEFPLVITGSGRPV